MYPHKSHNILKGFSMSNCFNKIQFLIISETHFKLMLIMLFLLNNKYG